MPNKNQIARWFPTTPISRLSADDVNVPIKRRRLSKSLRKNIKTQFSVMYKKCTLTIRTGIKTGMKKQTVM